MYTKDILINELNRCPDLVKVFGEALDKYNQEAEDREKARINKLKPLWIYTIKGYTSFYGVIFANDQHEAKQILADKYGHLDNNCGHLDITDSDVSLVYVNCVDPCLEVWHD